MKAIQCIIIDDDCECRETLKQLIQATIPSIITTSRSGTVDAAMAQLQSPEPKIIFMDTHLAHTGGFAALKAYKHLPHALIMTAQTDLYALQAIKAGAVDYLLKPLDANEFETACYKALNILSVANAIDGHRRPIENIAPKPAPDSTIPIRVGGFYELVSTDEIVFCKSNNNYTEIMMNDKRKFLLSKTLKFYENRLKGANFCRIHQRFLVNMNFIKSIEKGRYSHIVLKDGTTLDIAQARKDNIFKMLGV